MIHLILQLQEKMARRVLHVAEVWMYIVNGKGLPQVKAKAFIFYIAFVLFRAVSIILGLVAL